MLNNEYPRKKRPILPITDMPPLSEQHFTEGDEMEDDLDDDNIYYIIIEEIERSRKAV